MASNRTNTGPATAARGRGVICVPPPDFCGAKRDGGAD